MTYQETGSQTAGNPCGIHLRSNSPLIGILIIAGIGMPGVPMAEVIAVPGSAGAAVGLALQGALSNLAGGILLMILRS